MTHSDNDLHRRLLQNEEFNRRLLEAMPGGVVHVASDGNILFANGEAQRLLGMSLDGLTQRYVVDWSPSTWHEDGTPCTAEDYPVTQCLMTGEAQRAVTIGVQKPDGEMSWAVFSAVPVTDPQTGTQTGAVVTFLDITRRIQAEQGLAESETRYRRIVDASSEGIFVVDATLQLTFVNRRACELLGYSRAELEGMDGLELVPPEWKPEALRRVDLLRTGQSQTFEFPIRHKLGHTVWVLVSATPISDPDGSHAGLLVMCTDLTRHRQMEEALREAEKMRAVGQLAGGIAHDFNNQLTAIHGFAELLLEQTADRPMAADHARTILRAAARGASLTQQLLAFARRGKYQHAQVNVHGLIDELTVLLEHSVGPEVRIVQDLEPAPVYTIGDADQLHNAMLNIALNARDAMPGGGSLTIRVRPVELEDNDRALGAPDDPLPAGPYVLIDFTDTGVGMDAATAARCFEPFFSTKGAAGTGMGLAAAWGTVANHRGTIMASSEPGTGTTFRIYLPLSVTPSGASGRDHADRVVPGSAHVVVIDDEPLVRQFALRSLSELGYRVTLHDCGAAALDWLPGALAGDDPPGVVLLDMRMPGMSGSETWAALHEVAPDLPVILMSGYSLDGDAQRLLDDGVRAFIQKPFSIAALSRALSAAVDHQ